MSRIKKVRPILQMEMTECGAASLAMVLDYYGKTVTMEELRRDCGVSRNGINAKNIVLAARQHHLETRAIRAETEDIKDVDFPAIIHWNMDHFVVLCGFSGRGAVIADPEYGLRTVSEEEFSKSFTGIAILMKPDSDFVRDRRKTDGRNYIFGCIKTFLPAMLYLILIEVCMLLGDLTVMLVRSAFIDKILVAGNTETLGIMLSMLVFAGVMSVAVLVVRKGCLRVIGKHINTTINTGFMERIFDLPIDFFENRSEGDLANRQIANMQLGREISDLIFPIPAYAFQSLIYLVMFFVLSGRIAWIAVGCAVFNLIAMMAASRRNRARMMVYRRDFGMLEGYVSHSMNIIDTIKSCGAEDAIYGRLAAKGSDVLNAKAEMERTAAISEGIFLFLDLLCNAAILVAGAIEILNGSMISGVLIASQAIAAAMLTPMGMGIKSGMAIHSLSGDIERTDDVMRYGEDDTFLDEGKSQKREMEGDITLSSVAFSHNAVEEPVIKNIDMTIKQGSTVAICGSSGAGKSTVARMIAGIYSQTEGALKYNGLKKEEINHLYFYSKVGMVSQKVRLFEGTVAENISMWDSSVTNDDITHAAKMACIHDSILARPNGYDGWVSENGKNFSGGQRQRIEIARALVKKPSLLILDEATSALDDKTEAEILKNIRDMNVTTIIVAHRLSAIRGSDEIFVMDKGEIAEHGTHDNLMKKQGLYFKLVRNDLE